MPSRSQLVAGDRTVALDDAPRPADGFQEALDAAPVARRTDLDRALTRTASLLNPFLLLQSIPSFLAQRSPGAELVAVSIALATLPCVLVVVALGPWRRVPPRTWLLVAACGYLPLAGLEGAEASASLSIAYLPWLLTVAPVFIACFAIGVRRIVPWAIGTLAAAAGMAAVYTGRLPADRLSMTVFGLVLFSAGAYFGVRALRRRAARAEAAQQVARDRYDESQRRIAVEEERTRTDALLHDSLLNALLAAAAADDGRARTDATRDARHAIGVLHDRSPRIEPLASFAAAESAAVVLERELDPVRALVRLDLAPARGVDLPRRVTEALAAATLQAVNNSIKHAGADAQRSVRAEPAGADGVVVRVSDDGHGFDPAGIAPERLGVRVSIIGRLRAVGGAASVESAPGGGTTVTMTWAPPAVVGPGTVQA